MTAKDDNKPPRPRRSTKRKALRIAGWVVGIPVGLVVLLLIVLHTGPAQRKIASLIEARVGERVNGDFHLGQLDFALFGDVTLQNVRVTDEAGTEVIALDRLHVAPDWSALIGGQIALDRVALDGVRLALEEDDEGQLNLKRLFKKKPPKPKEPPKPKKDRHIVVRDLHVGDVNVTLQKADGTTIALRDFGLDGRIDTIPTQKTAQIELRLNAALPSGSAPDGAALRLEKPADGLTVSVTGIGTGVSVDVTEGEGTVSLQPTKAQAKISQEGFDDRKIDFELEGIDVAVGPGELEATLQDLALGAVVLRSLEIEGGIAEGSLSGEQKVQVVGLRLDAARFNELLQKDILASDIAIDTAISGPPEAMAIDSTIDTAGGKVVIEGLVDASDAASPAYDLSVLATDIRTEQLLKTDAVPPVIVDRLRIGVRGAGRTKSDAEADLGLHIAGLRAKGYVIDDVVGEVRYDGGRIDLHPLKVQAYGHELLVNGWVDLTRKLVDARVTMAGDVGKTLANLREGGLSIRTQLPRGVVVLHEDVVTIDVRGQLEGQLSADVAINDFRVLGGAIHGNAHASLRRNPQAGPDEKKIALEDLDAVIELRGISINQALALRGKQLDGVAATVSGKVVVDDAPQAPRVDYDLAVRAQGSQGGMRADQPMVQARVKGRATKERLGLSLGLDGLDAGVAEALLTAEVSAPLVITDSHKGIAPHGPLKVSVDIPDKRFKDILYYLPPKLLVDPKTGKQRDLPRGSIAADIDIEGSAAAPRGDFDVTLEAKLHPLRRQRLKIDGTVSSQGGVVIDSDLGVWLDTSKDETLKGRIRAELARSPIFAGPKKIDWTLDLDLLPQTLEDWVEAKVVGLEGVVSAGIHLEGNERDVTGAVSVDVERLKVKGKGPFGLHLGVAVEPERTGLDVAAQIDGTPVLAIDGTVGRAGEGLLAALRDKTPGKSLIDKLGPTPLDVTVRVPKHAPKTYAKLGPKLAELPGTFGGSIHVGGDLKTPVAEGAIGYQDFTTRSGKPGRAALALDAGATELKAAIELGPVAGGEPPVAIRMTVPRAQVKPYLAAKKCWQAQAGDPCPEAMLPIAARVDAHDVDLADLVPEFAIGNEELKFAGKLDWDLKGDILLDPEPRYRGEGDQRVKLPPISPDSDVNGELTLRDGTIALLDSGRHYEQVQLALHHDLSGVRLDKLSLRESDREKPERKLDAVAELKLNDFKPGKMTVHLTASDWLVFGHEKVGPMDAPHASLDADVRVEGDLGGRIKKIDVTVPKLELLAPKRFRRAHQPESLSPTGDIIELENGMEPGKLPVPPGKGARAEERAEAPGEDPVEEPARPPTGLDLHVTIPERARVLLHPLDLVVTGEIDFQRRGASKDLSGELAVVDGSLALGGRKHQLKEGKITFSNECAGCVDLLYARKEHPTTLREVSKASAGNEVTIHLRGPLTDRETTLGGAASPGTLYDLLSAHNAGRPWHKSQPDMPATITVEYPHYENLLLLSYLSVNVPQFLFMDKVAAWADAYDGRNTETYGEIMRYEAEGYSDDGSWRVRAAARPPTAGASGNELQLDWLFSNTPQTAFGVGLSAGDRLGGGPGIFFEWSSKD